MTDVDDAAFSFKQPLFTDDQDVRSSTAAGSGIFSDAHFAMDDYSRPTMFCNKCRRRVDSRKLNRQQTITNSFRVDDKIYTLTAGDHSDEFSHSTTKFSSAIGRRKTTSKPARAGVLRVATAFLLAAFTFSTLFDVARCVNESKLSGRSNGNVSNYFNGDFTSTFSTVNVTNRHRRTQRHYRLDEKFDDGDAAPYGRNRHHQRQMSKAAIRQLSRMAFKALISEDFEDRTLRPPSVSTVVADGSLTAQQRREFRRQQRKLQRQLEKQQRNGKMPEKDAPESDGEGGDLLPPPSDYNKEEPEADGGRLPGRRRAVAIATRDSIKTETCRTMPLKQRVRMTGCQTKILVNNFCYGQCNSFYIPKLSKKRLRAAFESCPVCRPKTYAPVVVTLDCPSRDPPYVKRRLMKIKECACMPPDSPSAGNNDVLQPSE